MCEIVTLMLSSVNSWRCVFYFFAFVCGLLALSDVSCFWPFPMFHHSNCRRLRVCLLCQRFRPSDFLFALMLLDISCFLLSLPLSRSLCSHHVDFSCVQLVKLVLLSMSCVCASGFFSHSDSWLGALTCMSSWQTFICVDVFPRPFPNPTHTRLLLFLLAAETLVL